MLTDAPCPFACFVCAKRRRHKETYRIASPWETLSVVGIRGSCGLPTAAGSLGYKRGRYYVVSSSLRILVSTQPFLSPPTSVHDQAHEKTPTKMGYPQICTTCGKSEYSISTNGLCQTCDAEFRAHAPAIRRGAGARPLLHTKTSPSRRAVCGTTPRAETSWSRARN